MSEIRARLPEIRVLSRPWLKRCLLRYIGLGWSGYVPRDCRDTLVVVPANARRWMWGWPNRFLRRMDRAGTHVIVIGDYRGEGFSQGIDDPERLKEFPSDFSGTIWTDRIDLLGPAASSGRD